MQLCFELLHQMGKYKYIFEILHCIEEIENSGITHNISLSKAAGETKYCDINQTELILNLV